MPSIFVKESYSGFFSHTKILLLFWESAAASFWRVWPALCGTFCLIEKNLWRRRRSTDLLSFFPPQYLWKQGKAPDSLSSRCVRPMVLFVTQNHLWTTGKDRKRKTRSVQPSFYLLIRQLLQKNPPKHPSPDKLLATIDLLSICQIACLLFKKAFLIQIYLR